MSEEHVLYLNDFHAIVCRECRHGIAKEKLQRHFRMFHKNVELHVRRELDNYVRGFEVWDIKDVPVPKEEVDAVEGLKVYEGYICTVEGCKHLRGTIESITRHCKEKHEWTTSRGITVSRIPLTYEAPGGRDRTFKPYSRL